ncbi:hypothetical protein WKI58_00445 [Streptomyces halotolerans]|uniref:Uncharacterized protein n=1 Tax=Streptomyces pratisoli TaxID=3139917 RepID=A0ACC6Q9J3_9ACTN
MENPATGEMLCEVSDAVPEDTLTAERWNRRRRRPSGRQFLRVTGARFCVAHMIC